MVDIPRVIRALLGQPEPSEQLPPLDYKGTMDIHELSSTLIDKFPNAPLYLPDYWYKTCSVEDVERFLEWDKTNLIPYRSEEHDCDDFAWRLKGQFTQGAWAALPIGIVWTDVHALCCFVADDKRFYYIEPQNDLVQVKLEDWQGKEVRFIAM